MTEFKDWQITIEFKVPKGDVEGDWTDAILEAGLEAAPDCIVGMVAGADTHAGRVTLTFTAVDTSEDFVCEIKDELRERIPDAIRSSRSGGDGQVYALSA